MRPKKKRRAKFIPANSRVVITHGIYGPSHDPYGWTEIDVYRYGRCYTARTGGLGEAKLLVDNKLRKEFWGENNFDQLDKAFAKLTGWPPDQWAHWHEVRRYRDGTAELEAEMREAEIRAGWDPNP
jgi:hypothetical protein